MPKFSKIEIETPKTEIKLDTQQNPDIGLERLGGAFLNLEIGDVPEAISRHNLDEKSHPYILRTYATREYAESLVKTFVYEQGIASDEWFIEHNLNKNPAVSVVDSAGNEIIASVQYVDENTVVIKMNGAFKGKAYLN